MMKLNERIKFFRTLNGWTQEEVAEKLNMSPNGYGNIERGDNDVTFSRLEQLAEVYKIDLAELLGLHHDTYIFSPVGSGNKICQNLCNNYSNEQLQTINEKQVIIIEQQTKRIELLEQQVCDLRKMLDFLRKPTS